MKRSDFNHGWRFQKAGADQWQAVTLPHDAMIHETRDPQSPGGNAIGFFTGDVYVYGKTFAVPEDWQDKDVVFEFEGIYKNSKVYLNGQEAGGRPYGYSRFFVQADRFLRYGEENTLRVVADNSQLPNSRWYSGSGIYRPVYLWVGNKTHLEPDGVKVSTLSYAPARILVETTVNDGEISVEILDDDQVIATGCGASVEFSIANARLWSAETPHLYRCRVTLKENGQFVDEVIEHFGIRKVAWSNKGLFINGQETLLRGGCIHHDNGILGACAYDKAEERRVRILKESGFNAIRSAHNPTSKALLDACDRYGMYVMDETFDMWYMHKNKYDYASDFDDWYREDIKLMVDKDFNHPSVIMYSIGNEVSEPYQERGIQLTREMVDYLHNLDPNRAVTAGINLFLIYMASKGRGIYKEEAISSEDQPEKKKKPAVSGSLFFNLATSLIGPIMSKIPNLKAADQVTSPGLDALDIAGYNYAMGRYPLEDKKHPDRIVVGSETFHQDIAANWAMVEKYPYLIGDFMWTGWDYLGEAGIGRVYYDPELKSFLGEYPWHQANCGDLDLCGFKRPQSYYRDILWSAGSPLYIAVHDPGPGDAEPKLTYWGWPDVWPNWTWPGHEGETFKVDVYAACDKVELRLNGQSLGVQPTGPSERFISTFAVPYQPGALHAIGYRDEDVVAEHEIHTVGSPVGIRLTPDRSDLTADGGDLSFVTVEVVDRAGRVNPQADNTIYFTVLGEGTLAAVGSGDPKSTESYRGHHRSVYRGRCLAVVRTTVAPGPIILRAMADGLDVAEVELQAMA